MRDVVILDGARTPFGEFCGMLRDINANDLGAIAARAAIDRSGVTPAQIDHVIFGNALQSAGDSLYGARHVALKSEIPIEVPAITVNRVCGSGLEALIYGAQLIKLAEAEICVVGGMENMSQCPHVIRGGRWGLPMGRSQIEDSLWVAMVDSYNDMPMAITAENLIDKYGITREEQDEFAFRSLSLAIKARDNGLLREEITPAYKNSKTKPEDAIWNDEHIQETSLDKLSKMKPVFKKNGGVTQGNSASVNDGAAALVIASSDKVAELGLRPRGRFVSSAVCGVDPDIQGIGPVPAIRMAAEKAGMDVHAFDLYEINEAFAAQYLACEKELALDREKVNVNGGAIAIGHPLAATGARLVLTLIYEMRRRSVGTGVVSLSIGGGQGIAGVFERL
jgi:acetyl-CoA C-acetyltransferase